MMPRLRQGDRVVFQDGLPMTIISFLSADLAQCRWHDKKTGWHEQTFNVVALKPFKVARSRCVVPAPRARLHQSG